jgi:hypothetical protein
MRKFLSALIICLSAVFYSGAQSFNTYLNPYFSSQIDRGANSPGNNFHTSFKPYKSDKIDSSWFRFPDPYRIGRNTFAGRVLGNFVNDHLVRIDTGDLYIRISPLFNFEGGYQQNPGKKIYTNTRGFLVNGYITKRLAFSTSFYENQSVFPDYLNTYIRTYKVVPGQGFVRQFKGGNGYDYGMAEGYVSFSAAKYFNLELGHGKHFIGDGYRSLLLSDNAFNYPYFKITTEIWKLKYTNLFAQFQQLEGNPAGKGYPKKFGTFHILSMNIGKRLQVGLYESIIWKGGDSLNNRGFDFNYINPIIFYRPVEFSLGSADNAMIGFTGKYKLSSKTQLYCQMILDDFNINELKKGSRFIQQKFGYQAGIRTFDLILKNSIFRLEYNQVQPYVYGHRVAGQNFIHYNQPLAHPFMANFRELVSTFSYNFRRWVVDVNNVYGIIGKDRSGSHYGNNIFIPENSVAGFPVQYGNQVTQGIRTTVNYFTIKGGYIINPRLNMRLEAGYSVRNYHNNFQQQHNQFFTIGFKTALRNYYYDF